MGAQNKAVKAAAKPKRNEGKKSLTEAQKAIRSLLGSASDKGKK